jgi:hypothetical protein
VLRLLRLLCLQNRGAVFFLDYAGFFNLLLLFVRLRIVPLLMMKMLPRRGGGQKRRHQRKTTSTITLRRRQNTRSHHHRLCRTTRRRHHHLFSLSLSLLRAKLSAKERASFIRTNNNGEKSDKTQQNKRKSLMSNRRKP